MVSSHLPSNDPVGEITGDDSAGLVTTNHFSGNDERKEREADGMKNLCDLPDELLVQVLSQVPAESRAAIRTVSKKWHTIICDIGYYVEPDFMNEEGLPFYEIDVMPRINPAIIHFALGIEGPQYLESIPKLLRRRSEFITSPPISVIHMRWTRFENRTPSTVSVTIRTATPARKRSEGIRVGDLLDIMEKLKPTRADDRDLFATCFVNTSREHHQSIKVVQERAGKSGIEVRRFRITIGYD